MSDPIAALLAAQAGASGAADPIAALLHAQAKTAPAPGSASDPSEGRLPFEPFGIDTGLNMPQGVSRFMAGAGKAFADIGRGAGQLVGAVDRKDIDEAKRLDAPLMNTGAGTAGNIVGNLAALAPTVFVPGAATIGGGAAIGAASSALQPVGKDDSRLQNMAVGGAAGAAVPAAIRMAKVLKAGLVDPFTEAGRQRIVGNTLNRAAADPARAAQNMSSTTGATPGFAPTAGQAADDAGIASVERTARAIDPAGFGDVDRSQRSALIAALRGIAKTPEDRAAAVDAVNNQAKNLYGEAFKENVEVTPSLSRLAGRPSMQAAEKRALSLADELGINFDARLKDMRPQYEPYKPVISPSSVETIEEIAPKIIPLGRRNLPDARVLEKQKPMDYTDRVDKVIPQGKGASEYFEVPGYTQPKTLSIPAEARLTSYMEIPPVESVPVRDMHTLKMGMDALLADPTLGIAGREAAAVKATRNKLLDLLPESYQKARLGHIEMNKPVNQMDIGQELYNRLVPALADGADVPFKVRADAFANALRNGDQVAKSVTGMKGSSLEGIMAPEQMATLQGIVKDSQLKAAAEGAGRGVGSDTVQKMAMSNLVDQAGLPSWIGALAPLRSVGGMARTAGDILYTKNDETMRHLLADVLKNPQSAAAAMQKAGVGPGAYARLLRMAGQDAAMATSMTANASK